MADASGSSSSSATASSSADGSFRASIKTVQGQSFDIELSADATVAQLKDKLVQPSGIPAAAQRLVYAGRILKDTEQLRRDHNFKSGNVIHLVKVAAATTQSPAAATSTTPAASSASAASRPAAASGSLFGQAPASAPFGANLMNDPQLMQSLMSSPIMQSMMENPELMRNILMSNPGYRNLMESNPELAQAMLDPALLRRSMQAMRDPTMMAEMMRQQDRALSNVEAMPGGMNFLNRMYRDVMNPLEEGFEAAAAPPATDPALDDNPFAALLQPPSRPRTGAPNTEPLPNPWAPQPSRTTTASSTASSAAGGGFAGANAFASLFGGGGAGPSATAAPTGHNTDSMYGDGSTSSTASSSAPSAPSAALFPGLGALSFAGLGSGGLPPGMDASAIESMLENPAFQAEMQRVMSNPEMFRAMMQSHPMYRSDPMVQQAMNELLERPEALAEMMRPENLRATLQMQRLLSGAGGPGAGGLGGLAGLGSLGGFGPGATPSGSGSTGSSLSSAGTSNTSSVPPRERYQAQLAQLADMGFSDEAANLTALQRSNGDVQMAIQFLLG